MLSSRDKETFRRTVYAHYRAHGRSLPWRRTRDPYRILVSEFMLQQTQVGRAAVKYGEFIRRFPTVRALASASTRDILRAWQGLGYNRRALFLGSAARAIVADHGSRVPGDTKTLMALPGVGQSTAGAVAAFGFGSPSVFIETNIRSVFIHHFFPSAASVSDDEILPLIAETVDRRDPRRWYYALMDYGVHIKESHPNPGRRSSSYARQSPFHGSDRQARGMVVKALLERRGLGFKDLLGRTGAGEVRLRRVLDRLRRDGIAVVRRGRYDIA